MLARRAYDICSSPILIDNELKHLKHAFCTINKYPINFVENIFEEVRNKQNLPTRDASETQNTETSTININLPYAGNKGNQLMRKLNVTLKPKLPDNTSLRITYKSQKLASKFQVKDSVHNKHKYNCTYYAKCPDDNCDYIGETGRRLEERIIDHNTRDQTSHLLKHSREEGHQHVWIPDFKILGSNYSSKFKRKISEALFIKTLKPSLNIQERSYKLKLFN